MSLIYTTAFVGSIIAGLSNVWITDRIGFGLACVLGALAYVISYLLCGTGAPYAVFLVGYAFNGFGLSLLDAQVNNITSRLPNAGTKMAFVQACFGLGGTLAPFLSTAFAAHVDKAWYYYFVAMGVSMIALVVMLVAFDMRTEEQLIQPENWEAGEKLETAEEREHAEAAAAAAAFRLSESAAAQAELNEKSAEAKSETEAEADTKAEPTPTTPRSPAPKKPASSGRKMKRIFATPAVWALMGFSFLYIGVEVAISSWMTSFLIEKRGGNANSGYAVTGFWGGMTVGRVALLPITNRLGYQPSIYLYSAIALALELVVWFTNSLVGNGVCFAFVGFFLGPVYPNALMVIAETLDDDLRGGVMGLMGSIGGAGAAALPMMAGGIADRFGIWTLQPVAVALIAAYTALWATVPRKRIKSLISE
ncbi:hypothetical protein CcaverHIS002_0701710 [Cutaneotrichosporon cavernicola]|nr:hypothetical protein CcaverHIS002_0701710 [Cutaneotrichosporon cavernicola]BEJ02379.1 hypothetical protein CcaverHIS631_0701740 [Cutaneotrichosporon cavernicola]BEJ10136.1 hypothetical protein CcaverHIS641_0701710 [Cutaneotrichosporon cavernicola]